MGRVATLRDIQAAKSFADKFVTPWLNKAISFFGSLFETVEEVETTEEDEVTHVVTFAPEVSATPVVISNEGKFVELAGQRSFTTRIRIPIPISAMRKSKLSLPQFRRDWNLSQIEKSRRHSVVARSPRARPLLCSRPLTLGKLPTEI